MIKSISGVIQRVFAITDILAGVCFFSVMVLVLSNVIVRKVYKPITGTFEIVGLLIATGLGFALANCEMLDGNIGMDIELHWFSPKVEKVMEVVSYIVSLSFWVVVDWRIIIYANTSLSNGRVTSTASIPIYPFIYLLGFNVFCLCIVLTYKLVCAIGDASAKFHEAAQERKEGGK